MTERALICVVCPVGCELAATLEDGEAVKVVGVRGAVCAKGEEWARDEIENPMRVVTSSILVEGGELPLVSVRTDCTIPLGAVRALMAEIRRQRVAAPVRLGAVLLESPAGIPCSVIATRTVERAKG